MRQLELRVEGSHSIDELVSLQNQINEEHGLRGTAAVERRPFTEGSLGAAFDLVSVALSPGGAAAILAPVLITWLRQRRSSISIRIKRKDGSEIEIKAEKVRNADPVQLRQLTSEVAEALEDQ